MFNVNTSTHMLGFVLWSGRVGAQGSGLRLKKSRLWSDVTRLWWYTCLFQMDGCDHTMSYHMWSFSLLDGCDHTLVLLWSSLMDGCAHTWVFWDGCDHTLLSSWSLQLGGCIHTTDLLHMSFGWLRPCLDYMYFTIRDMSCTCACRLSTMVFWFAYDFVNNFTPPTLSAFML